LIGLPDLVGLIGVLLILVAYAAAALGRLDPTTWPALTLNLVGAGLILFSLAYDPNIAAIAMEAAWALIALFGLLRVALRRRSGGGPA
jgi:hypothetical protein